MFGVWYQTYDVNDVCCLISDVSCQMSDITHQIWHHTSNNSYMTVNCYQTSHVRCLISHIRYDITRLITAIWQLTVIRRLMSDVLCCVILHLTLEVRDHITVIKTSDVWCYMLCYITSAFRHPTSYNCYQTSDLWYDIRRLISDKWHQTTDNSYMMSNV